jgi:uncharacterized protein
VSIVRRPPQAGRAEVSWDPEAGVISVEDLLGLRAVVHLAGESVAGRWTRAKKDAILHSRVNGTRTLACALARLPEPRPALIMASAVGYYGDCADRLVTEETPHGQGFLAEVCQQWEAAAAPARDAGVRVVMLRLGMLLSSTGGALPHILAPFRSGLGGVLGSGHQYLSWVALEDAVGAVRFVLDNPMLTGPVNVVAPEAITNADLTALLGRLLGQTHEKHLPAMMVKLLLGEMGETLLLHSTRAVPQKLLAAGFQHQSPDLEAALRRELAASDDLAS